MKTTKKILAGLSSLSLGFSAETLATEVKNYPDSPLLGSKAPMQSGQVLQALIQNAGGQITKDNIQQTINTVVQNNPGISLNTLASSLDKLNLDKEGTKNAVLGLSSAYNVPIEQAVSTVITETYLDQGKEASTQLSESLKESFGEQVVEQALNVSNETQENFPSISESYGYQSSPYNG